MGEFLYTTVGIGVGSTLFGGLLVYLIMKGKVQALKEDLDEAKRYIKKLESIDYKKEYIKRTTSQSSIGTTSINETLNKTLKDLTPSQNSFNHNKEPTKQIEKNDLTTISRSSNTATLDELKTLSKVVEEVESLSFGGDILPSISEIENENLDSSKNNNSLPVFKEHFQDNPNIKREDFKKFAGVKVLVAEDNPVNSKLIDMLFDKSGIIIDIAENGVIAITKLKEAMKKSKPYDLVLMDIHMPKMNGLEATRMIREDKTLSDTPVLALTASTNKDEVEAILSSGMNGFLNKPIKLGKIYTAFDIFLKDKQVKKEKKSFPKKMSPTGEVILDIGSGVSHSNGDEKLYKNLLADFLKNYSDSADKFKRYVTRGDLIALRALMVDLEGLAGTLGANELYLITKEINESLQDHKGINQMIKYIPKFKNIMERLKSTINSYIN